MSEISGKWYQSLFWLLIICTVARTISNGEGDGMLYTLLWFVNVLATAVYGAVLLKMEHFSAHFRMAGLCKAASASVGIVSSAASYFLDGSLLVTLIILVVIVSAVVDIAGEYQEFAGHSEFARDRDVILSEKWLRLRQWYVGMLAGFAVGTVCSALLFLPGVIAMLACGIGLVVVSILKIVYVYRMAGLCQARRREEGSYDHDF